MITVIIPTLWRCDRLQTTLMELSQAPEVGEILLFDNTENQNQLNIPKLNHILEGKNTYVGAPWNKGAKIAKFDHLLFLNDDTWFNTDYLKKISNLISPGKGMLGISRRNYEISSPVKNPLELRPVNNRPNAFACLFFIHRQNWIPIPDEIKIWATDCWQFTKNMRAGRQNYVLDNFPVFGFVSKTVGYMKQNKTEEFMDIIKQDLKLKEKYNLI